MLVRMFQPNSVRCAFTLAKMHEATTVHGSVTKSWTKQFKPEASSKPPLLPTPPKIISKTQDTLKTKQQASKTLTHVYMSDRRAKCYVISMMNPLRLSMD